MALISSSWIESKQARKRGKRYKQCGSKQNRMNSINSLYNKNEVALKFPGERRSVEGTGRGDPLSAGRSPISYILYSAHSPTKIFPTPPLAFANFSKIPPNLYPHPLLPFYPPKGTRNIHTLLDIAKIFNTLKALDLHPAKTQWMLT